MQRAVSGKRVEEGLKLATPSKAAENNQVSK